jgi:hypothetical protein
MKVELIIKYYKVFPEHADSYKYYSPKTLYNLIYHLDSLEDGNKKKQITKQLNEYLDFVSENIINNIEDSQMVYKKYLHPIVRYYVKKVGFISYGKPQFLLPLYLIPTSIILYFLNSLIVWIIVFLFLLSSFVYNYNKYKQKKTYGLAW